MTQTKDEIRRQYAMSALTGILANGAFWNKGLQEKALNLNTTISTLIAVSAFDIADAMISEEQKQRP